MHVFKHILMIAVHVMSNLDQFILQSFKGGGTRFAVTLICANACAEKLFLCKLFCVFADSCLAWCGGFSGFVQFFGPPMSGNERSKCNPLFLQLSANVLVE